MPGFDGCLEHLDTDELDTFLATLKLRADLDARGTTLSASLVTKLLQPLHNSYGHPLLGRATFTNATIETAQFANATFTRDASFDGVRFSGPALFSGARFDRNVSFHGARFEDMAGFIGTRFKADAQFGDVSFAGDAYFNDQVQVAGVASFIGATFGQLALFDGATFDTEASFSRVRFTGDAFFTRATFGGGSYFAATEFDAKAWFIGAHFDQAVDLGPLRAPDLSLARARFTRFVSVLAEVNAVSCLETRFEDGVALDLRYGTLMATRTMFGAPSTIAGVTEPFLAEWTDKPEWIESSAIEPGLLSLRGTDVSDLVLTDVNLSRCEFAGAHRLDQLGLEGRCEFSRPPRGWRRTSRQVLDEEARWRGWTVAVPDAVRVGPERLAALYRSLRKALEDAKYEAGAGDFYYGEMEMRRHSTETRRAERLILWVYWLLSGYGQRGGRALTALLVLVATVGALLVFCGQPVGEAAKIAVGAVVLREAGTELTTAGEWTVMAARFLGPVLLALAVLAVRARVKR